MFLYGSAEYRLGECSREHAMLIECDTVYFKKTFDKIHTFVKSTGILICFNYFS